MTGWDVVVALAAGGLGGLIGSLITMSVVRALTPWWAKGGWRR